MELASRCRIVERIVWQTSSLIRLSMLTVKPMFIWIKVLVNWVLFAASYSAHLGQRGSVQELWLICGIVFFLHVSCRNGRRRRPYACGCCIQIRVAGQKLGKPSLPRTASIVKFRCNRTSINCTQIRFAAQISDKHSWYQNSRGASLLQHELRVPAWEALLCDGKDLISRL